MLGDLGKTVVQILVYRSVEKHKFARASSRGLSLGELVVCDALERNGIEVGECGIDGIGCRVLLVSFTSSQDVWTFYRLVSVRDEWRRRNFKVIVGGAGLQNPIPIRHYVDYALFGRCEGIVSEVVQSILGGSEPKSLDCMMRLPDITPVKMRQVESVYPRRFGKWHEEFVGCPLKCRFCHYTYARKHIGGDGAYFQAGLAENSPEITWDQMLTSEKRYGRLLTAVDGWSERLRYVYGKRIADDDITAGLEALGRRGKTTMLRCYNIGNFPTELDSDRRILVRVVERAKPRGKVVMVLHTTPFRPSPATPMQWEPVSLLPDNSQCQGQTFVDNAHIRASHALSTESPWPHLLSVIAERATVKTDSLFKALAFWPSRPRSGFDRVGIVGREFDLSPYLRRYELDEPSPTWFVDGYMSKDLIRRSAAKMRAQIKRTIDDPGWLPGKVSMVRAKVGV